MIYAEQISLAPTYNEKISSENYEITFRGTWLTIGRNRGSDRIFYKLGNKPCCISSSTKCTSLADVSNIIIFRCFKIFSKEVLIVLLLFSVLLSFHVFSLSAYFSVCPTEFYSSYFKI